MTTTNSNGIVFLEATDPITPFHTLINTLQTGTSNALDGWPTARGPWANYSPSVVSGLSIGNGSLHAAYARFGRTIHFRIWVVWGTTTAATSGAFSISLPTPSASATSILGAAMTIDSSSGNRFVGVSAPDGASGATPGRAVALVPVSASTSASTFAQAGVPFVWASGDVFSLAGTYEAAS